VPLLPYLLDYDHQTDKQVSGQSISLVKCQ